MATNFIGNNDFRGYLNYLAQNGDGNATAALYYAGNDGQLSRSGLSTTSGTSLGGWTGEQYGNWQRANAPAPTVDPNAAKAAADQADEQAYWQDQINNAQNSIGRLSGQRDIGNQNIDNSYNNGFQSLTNSKAADYNQYNTTKTRDIQDNIQNKAQIDDGVRTQLTGIQRLLGARGAGGGSAATILAPHAAAVQGNQRRAQVQQTFGRNMSDLDTNWNTTEAKFNNAFGQLATDRDNERNKLESGFKDTELGLNSTMSDAAVHKAQAGGQTYTQARAARTPYESRINQLGDQITQLGKVGYFNPQAVQYADPTLQQYKYDQFSAPVANNGMSPALAEGTGVYSNLLNADEKKKQASPFQQLQVA